MLGGAANVYVQYQGETYTALYTFDYIVGPLALLLRLCFVYLLWSGRQKIAEKYNVRNDGCPALFFMCCGCAFLTLMQEHNLSKTQPVGPAVFVGPAVVMATVVGADKAPEVNGVASAV